MEVDTLTRGKPWRNRTPQSLFFRFLWQQRLNVEIYAGFVALPKGCRESRLGMDKVEDQTRLCFRDHWYLVRIESQIASALERSRRRSEIHRRPNTCQTCR